MKIEDVQIGQFGIARGSWPADCVVFPSQRKLVSVDRYFMITSVDTSDNTVWLDGAGWWPVEYVEPLTTEQVQAKIHGLASEAERLKYALEHPMTLRAPSKYALTD